MKKMCLLFALIFLLSACSNAKVNQLEDQISQHLNTITEKDVTIASLEQTIQNMQSRQAYNASFVGTVVANLHQTFNIGKQSENDDELSAILIQMFQGPCFLVYASDAQFEAILAFQNDPSQEGKQFTFDIVEGELVRYGVRE